MVMNNQEKSDLATALRQCARCKDYFDKAGPNFDETQKNGRFICLGCKTKIKAKMKETHTSYKYVLTKKYEYTDWNCSSIYCL